tara:strand:- start:1186 stop:2001 length:816 start_codon:yes stop_codon:yes gene_type:complete
MKKSNLFFVGSPKCGTSFLYEKLKFHPELYFTKTKEINHFSFSKLKESSYYRDYKIETYDNYLKLYNSSKNEKYKVDASVSYFCYPQVAHQILNHNKNSKIIIILRDPIQRAFSHYQMDIRMSYADKSLTDYLKDKTSPHYTQYIGNSNYSKNVDNYINVFGEGNVLVLKLDELKNDLSKLFAFLQIDDLSKNIITEDKVNENKEARNFIARFFQKNRAITEKLKLIIPKSVITFFNGLIYKQAKKISITDEETELLTNILSKDIAFYNSL